MADNKLVNNIDLNLSNAELKTLISDIKLSLGLVVDVNHNDLDSDNLNVGEILVKSLDAAGTSELNDSIYKPLHSNINNYPIAGEFVVTLDTSIGRYYLAPINLFGDKGANIDKDNVSGYVKFTDDSNINKKQIQRDLKVQKSILENNKSPFDTITYNLPFPFFNRFGDVNIDGRYGNRISLTRSEVSDNPEMFLLNGVSRLELRNGSFIYSIKSSNDNVSPKVNTEITSEYEGEQIYLDSERLFSSIGTSGIFYETSGIISLIADDDIFINTSNNLGFEGNRINLGREANEKVVLGNTYLSDFKELVNSMIRFAKTLRAQEKILSVSNAANNFLTDINNLGWNDFDENDYLSEKVYTE